MANNTVKSGHKWDEIGTVRETIRIWGTNYEGHWGTQN